MTLSQPDCFTVTYELGTNGLDSVDAGRDPDVIPLMGTVRVVPRTKDCRPVQTVEGGLRLRTFRGYIDADGILKDEKGGTPGMRVWCNDPDFGLNQLWYEVIFDGFTTGDGKQVDVLGGAFEAPPDDISIPLNQVLASTGSSIVATGRQLGLYVSDIVGSGATGRALVASDDQAAAWTALGVAPSANLPSYVDDVLEFANRAAFPATGATGKIYVALDNGHWWRWSGSLYIEGPTLGFVQAAKNPDVLVTGAITVDGNDLLTSAAVTWPDGSPGTLTITSRDANAAVLAYNITYGSPVTKTYTQPTITRNANGAATNVPAIVVT